MSKPKTAPQNLKTERVPSAPSIKQLLRQANIRPSKRLGQNFLISTGTLKKIIDAAELKPLDTVLEIGPGLGVLTIELAKRVGKVIALEKDCQMVSALGELLQRQQIQNVGIVNEDILNFPAFAIASTGKSTDRQLANKKYKLVANLPYNIATAVIMRFLEAGNLSACAKASAGLPAEALAQAGKPELMVVMVQKEVGQKICALPPRMSKLSVFCQLLSRPKIVGYVSKKSFYPQPKVDSAIIKFAPIGGPASLQGGRAFLDLFSKIVRAGFSHPRKQLIGNLSQGLNLSRQQTEQWLQSCNLSPAQRAETLTVADWLTLAKSFEK